MIFGGNSKKIPFFIAEVIKRLKRKMGKRTFFEALNCLFTIKSFEFFKQLCIQHEKSYSYPLERRPSWIVSNSKRPSIYWLAELFGKIHFYIKKMLRFTCSGLNGKRPGGSSQRFIKLELAKFNDEWKRIKNSISPIIFCAKKSCFILDI